MREVWPFPCERKKKCVCRISAALEILQMLTGLSLGSSRIWVMLFLFAYFCLLSILQGIFITFRKLNWSCYC